MLSPQVRDRAPLPRAAAGRGLLLPPHRHRRHLTNQEQIRRGSRTHKQVDNKLPDFRREHLLLKQME